MELELSEEEEDETEEQKAERAARRLKREVDMLRVKLTKLKDKEINAKSERKALREGMKKNQQLLKYEWSHCVVQLTKLSTIHFSGSRRKS